MFKALEAISINSINAPIEVFDWGCGQGIASVCLIQDFRKKGLIRNIKRITLVEPSKAALDRAKVNVMQSCGDVEVVTINKGLPASIKLPFEAIDDYKVVKPIAIHLFSNILDIPSINLKGLAELIASSGEVHYVLCIGPANRNESRIDSFCSNFLPQKALYYQFDNRTEEELNNNYSTPLIKPYYKNTEFFIDRSYGMHSFGCYIRAFKFDLSSGEPILIPYKFFAPKQFRAAYKSDLLDSFDDMAVTAEETAFDVLAPFDLGASVYDDIHPVLAVLNNIIVRGLPTKASPLLERLFVESINISQVDKKARRFGSIAYQLTTDVIDDWTKNLI